MEITIGFSKHTGFAPFSTAIRCYLDTEFSHTYFKVTLPGLNDASVLQATGKGISMCSYTNFLKHNIVVKEFKMNISNELFLELYNEFHDKAGTKYGYIQNIGILISNILKLKTNPFQDGIVCSEYIAYCLSEVYPDDWDDSVMDFNLVTPRDVYQYLVSKDYCG
jgi:hypothetical protein